MPPLPADAAATVTKIIHDARWMTGLTQAEVAQRAGVSQQTVAQYEGGKRQPSVAMLTRLVAGCGLRLVWRFVPEPGLEDEPTRELLALEPLDRLPTDMAACLAWFRRTTRGLDFLVGGKTAARMHGAAVRVSEAEIWLDEGVDLDLLGLRLAGAGVQYVSPHGEVGAAIPSYARLQGGWPVTSAGGNLWLRSISDFPWRHREAIAVKVAGSQEALMVASTEHCTIWWHDRDLDHLALQRAVRLQSGEER